jgi:dihydrofolate reductase
MRKLIYSIFVSLDGFIEGPNRELDRHVIDEELHTHANQQATGAFLMGRRMYEAMQYWDTADSNPSSPPYNCGAAKRQENHLSDNFSIDSLGAL